MGYYTGKFQYLVLPTGDIVQFGDDDRGHGALGGYPKVFGDASAQKHGIAVEMCCPPAKRRVNKMLVNETLEPNPRMVEGANYLVAHLQKKYNKTLNIGLSIDGYLASKTKHTDTLTWPTSTLRELGVSEESIVRRNDLLQRRFGVKNPSTLV